MTEGGDTKRLLLITSRHVLFKLHKHDNTLYKHVNNSQRRHDVIVDVIALILSSLSDEIEMKRHSACFFSKVFFHLLEIRTH